MKTPTLRKALLFLLLLFALSAVLLGCGGGDPATTTVPSEPHTVRYRDDAGEHSLTVAYGELYALSAIPTREGHDFLGLFDAEQGGTLYVNAQGEAVAPFCGTEDILLYPRFRPREYTVFLDYRGAEPTGMRSWTVSYGESIKALPLSPTLTDHVFLGWFTEPNGGGKQIADPHGILPQNARINSNTFDLDDAQETIVLYAAFQKPECTLQYTDDSGTHSLVVTPGSLWALEEIPTRTGHDFVGLFDAEKGGTQYTNGVGSALSPFRGTESLVLFPRFRLSEYTLVLDYGEAAVTGSRMLSVTYGSAIGGIPLSLTLAHHTFLGWFTEPNGGGKQVADVNGVLPQNGYVNEFTFDLDDPQKQIVLYAAFQKERHTLSLYAGDSEKPEEITVEYGTPISAVEHQSRVGGMAVLSWSTVRGDTERAHLFEGVVTGDMTLYSAELAPCLSFDAAGGDPVPMIVGRAGRELLLPTPKRESYVFIGWQTPTGVLYTEAAMPEESLALTAVWQPMLLLDANGGSETDSLTAPAGTELSLPEPEREGYFFAGWYTEDGTPFRAKRMPAESLSLIAGWHEKKEAVIRIITGDKKMELSAASEIETLRSSLTLDFSAYLPEEYSGTLDLHFHILYRTVGQCYGPYTYRLNYRSSAIVSANTLLFSYSFTIPLWSTSFHEGSWDQRVEMTGNKLYTSLWSNPNDTDDIYISDYFVSFEYADTSAVILK